jgi:hypothetical protein
LHAYLFTHIFEGFFHFLKTRNKLLEDFYEIMLTKYIDTTGINVLYIAKKKCSDCYVVLIIFLGS